MSAKDHGGPAFPQGELDATRGYTQLKAAAECGMTLRDYFAAKAMQGEIAAVHSVSGAWNPKSCAELAYEFADAMLAERAK